MEKSGDLRNVVLDRRAVLQTPVTCTNHHKSNAKTAITRGKLSATIQIVVIDRIGEVEHKVGMRLRSS